MCIGKRLSGASAVPEHDKWIEQLDLDAFGRDIKELGKKLRAEEGQEHVEHLEKIMMWSNMCLFIGIGLSFLPAYCLVPSVLICVGVTARWTMVGHHVIHGGYDRSKKYSRRKFAMGTWRRLLDWTDWMLPEGWAIEHNIHHHYKLNEDADPDLVERNFKFLRNSKVPRAMKFATVGLMMVMWKWSYYAPSTFKLYREHELKKGKQDAHVKSESTTLSQILQGKEPNVNIMDFVVRSMLPFLVRQFVLFPLAIGAIGYMVGAPITFFTNSLINIFVGEVLSNIHSYIIIVPNHSGEDMYTYKTEVTARSSEFYLRQVISSANFTSGNDYPAAKDLIDFMQGWLNYQIEHHLWPDLSMLSYQRSHAEVQRICAKHNVPFVKEHVFERLRKCTAIAIGDTSHIPFPHHLLKSKESAR